MKLEPRNSAGWTLIELLVLIAMLAIVFALIPTVPPKAKARAQRISCTSNLKQVGLATRLYVNDLGGQFSWQVPMASNGTLELATSPQVFRHFQALSNELVTPKVLVCPSDRQRIKTADFVRFSNTNLSYFVSLDARENAPQLILSGDRNITGGTLSNGFLRLLTPLTEAGWTSDLHNNAGNLGLADGSVQQVTAAGLRKQLAVQTSAVIRLAIP